MLSKVRLGSILALALMFSVSLAMRADTVFSSFGPNQSYQPKSWVDVGNGGAGDQVVAFPFVPTETAYLTSVDAALYNVGPSFALSIVSPCQWTIVGSSSALVSRKSSLVLARWTACSQEAAGSARKARSRVRNSGSAGSQVSVVTLAGRAAHPSP